MSANENADVLEWLGFKKIVPEEARPGETFSVRSGNPHAIGGEPAPAEPPPDPPESLRPKAEGEGFFFSLGIKLETGGDAIFITAHDGAGQGYSLKCTTETYVDLTRYGFTDAFEDVTMH